MLKEKVFFFFTSFSSLFFVSHHILPFSISPKTTALVDLYKSTGGDNWVNSEEWLGEGEECNRWYGVYCNQEGHITHLYDFSLMFFWGVTLLLLFSYSCCF